ncbi:LEA type 2 family protein [Ectothiorhodospiraceae bacterium WFHF3C12]|nr:LEA type 2 family protein [Ectothiorhodospiraceae bacterium WFHF3C12]
MRRIVRFGHLSAVLALALLVAGCAALRSQVEAPRVTLAAIGIESLGLLEQRFELTLRVQNPNGFPINISGMDYQVALNGAPFAAGVSNTGARVPASGEALVRVPVTANLLDTVQQVLKWRTAPPDAVEYALDGSVRLSGFDLRLPFEYSGSVPIQAGGG